MDKGLVNFQDINRKLTKIAQAGIAGAEVIHCKLYPHHFELLKYGDHGFGILHKDALGELKFEISRFQVSFRKYAPDTFGKTLIAELDGRNVDGDRQFRQSRVLPRAPLPACFTQHPTADLQN